MRASIEPQPTRARSIPPAAWDVPCAGLEITVAPTVDLAFGVARAFADFLEIGAGGVDGVEGNQGIEWTDRSYASHLRWCYEQIGPVSVAYVVAGFALRTHTNPRATSCGNH